LNFEQKFEKSHRSTSLPCDAEVADFHLLITRQKGISWLQISVDDAVFVEKLSTPKIIVHKTTAAAAATTTTTPLLLLLMMTMLMLMMLMTITTYTCYA